MDETFDEEIFDALYKIEQQYLNGSQRQTNTQPSSTTSAFNGANGHNGAQECNTVRGYALQIQTLSSPRGSSSAPQSKRTTTPTIPAHSSTPFSTSSSSSRSNASPVMNASSFLARNNTQSTVPSLSAKAGRGRASGRGRGRGSPASRKGKNQHPSKPPEEDKGTHTGAASEDAAPSTVDGEKKKRTTLQRNTKQAPSMTLEDFNFPEYDSPPLIDLDKAATWIYPSNYPRRDYQYSITKNALFRNTLVSLPTGLGKTFIAAVVMYNFYRWFPEPAKVVFMAPTKPLVAQQEEACFKIMGIPKEETALMTGSLSPHVRSELWRTKRVFFVTPQVIENDISRDTCVPKNIVCLVVDEAHRAQGAYAYCKVVKSIAASTRFFRVLALSATPGNDVKSVQRVIENLLISHLETRTNEDIDVRSYVNTTKMEMIKLPLSPEMQLVRQQFLELLKIPLRMLHGLHAFWCDDPEKVSKFMLVTAQKKFTAAPSPAIPPNRYGMIHAQFALAITLFHGWGLFNNHGLKSVSSYLEDLEKKINSGKVTSKAKKGMINMNEFQNLKLLLEQTCDQGDFNHPKLEKLLEIVTAHFEESKASETRVIIFTEYRDSVDEVVSLLQRHSPVVLPIAFVGQGAGRKSRGYTQKQQAQVIKDFKGGKYNTLVATCIGEEGLDIGEVDLIICFDAQASPTRMVQRFGRTGRKRAGRCVVLVTEGSEETVFTRNQSKGKSIVQNIMKKSAFSLYEDCPRMIPAEIKPKVVVQEMNVPTESTNETSGERNQKKAIGFKRKRNATGGFTTTKASGQRYGELSEAQQEWLRGNGYGSVDDLPPFAILEEPEACRQEAVMQLKMEGGSKAYVRNMARKGIMSCLANHLPEQAIPSPIFEVSHSVKASALMQTIQFVEDNAASSEWDYELELQNCLDLDETEEYLKSRRKPQHRTSLGKATTAAAPDKRCLNLVDDEDDFEVIPSSRVRPKKRTKLNDLFGHSDDGDGWLTKDAPPSEEEEEEDDDVLKDHGLSSPNQRSTTITVATPTSAASLKDMMLNLAKEKEIARKRLRDPSLPVDEKLSLFKRDFSARKKKRAGLASPTWNSPPLSPISARPSDHALEEQGTFPTPNRASIISTSLSGVGPRIGDQMEAFAPLVHDDWFEFKTASNTSRILRQTTPPTSSSVASSFASSSSSSSSSSSASTNPSLQIPGGQERISRSLDTKPSAAKDDIDSLMERAFPMFPPFLIAHHAPPASSNNDIPALSYQDCAEDGSSYDSDLALDLIPTPSLQQSLQVIPLSSTLPKSFYEPFSGTTPVSVTSTASQPSTITTALKTSPITSSTTLPSPKHSLLTLPSITPAATSSVATSTISNDNRSGSPAKTEVAPHTPSSPPNTEKPVSSFFVMPSTSPSHTVSSATLAVSSMGASTSTAATRTQPPSLGTYQLPAQTTSLASLSSLFSCTASSPPKPSVLSPPATSVSSAVSSAELSSPSNPSSSTSSLSTPAEALSASTSSPSTLTSVLTPVSSSVLTSTAGAMSVSTPSSTSTPTQSLFSLSSLTLPALSDTNSLVRAVLPSSNSHRSRSSLLSLQKQKGLSLLSSNPPCTLPKQDPPKHNTSLQSIIKDIQPEKKKPLQPGNHSSAPPAGWPCSTCTFFNEAVEAPVCKICCSHRFPATQEENAIKAKENPKPSEGPHSADSDDLEKEQTDVSIGSLEASPAPPNRNRRRLKKIGEKKRGILTKPPEKTVEVKQRRKQGLVLTDFIDDEAECEDEEEDEELDQGGENEDLSFIVSSPSSQESAGDDLAMYRRSLLSQASQRPSLFTSPKKRNPNQYKMLFLPDCEEDRTSEPDSAEQVSSPQSQSLVTSPISDSSSPLLVDACRPHDLILGDDNSPPVVCKKDQQKPVSSVRRELRWEEEKSAEKTIAGASYNNTEVDSTALTCKEALPDPPKLDDCFPNFGLGDLDWSIAAGTVLEFFLKKKNGLNDVTERYAFQEAMSQQKHTSVKTA
ncbi:FA complementation group M [Balamuthia mandrillaris]